MQQDDSERNWEREERIERDSHRQQDYLRRDFRRRMDTAVERPPLIGGAPKRGKADLALLVAAQIAGAR